MSDRQTACPLTFTDVREPARGLSVVGEATSYGTPALKVHGRLLARLWEDPHNFVSRVGL